MFHEMSAYKSIAQLWGLQDIRRAHSNLYMISCVLLIITLLIVSCPEPSSQYM